MSDNVSRRFAGLPQAVRDSLAAEQYCYLTTTGRLSGEQRTIEIWFAIENATVYMMAGSRYRAGWVANLRAQPRVSLRIGDETFHALARVVADVEEDALARRLLLQKYTDASSRTVDDDGLSDWGRRALPVAIDV